ncbi:MAG: hypothetical protein ACOX05_03025 [Bacillota bacterium]|jgi:hypothetical protein
MYEMICDCPYTYGGGSCIKESLPIEGAKACQDCPCYKAWYEQMNL